MLDSERDTPEDLAQLEVNECGTYGMGSASYWYGRLVSMYGRSVHYLLGPALAVWLTIFADDGRLLLPITHFRTVGPFVFFWFAILRAKVKYSKVRGGIEWQWIGFFENIQLHVVGISKQRADWVCSWLGKLVEDKMTDTEDFNAGLGRLGFVTRPLWALRPLLAPMYTWACGAPGGIRRRIPSYVLLLLTLFHRRLQARRTIRVGRSKPAKDRETLELFRADFSGMDDVLTIGGWCVVDEQGKAIPPSDALWFSVRLEKLRFPWLYDASTVHSLSASGELFASLVCIREFLPKRKGIQAEMAAGITGGTDNQSNSYVMDKGSSTRWPLQPILAELAWTLDDLDLDMRLCWRRRNENEHADALTKGDFSAFNLEHRIEPDLEHFQILDSLVECGRGFYKEQQERKAARVASRQEEARCDALLNAAASAAAAEIRRKEPKVILRSRLEVQGGATRRRKLPLRQRDPW
jgi:hypothetical protein